MHRTISNSDFAPIFRRYKHSRLHTERSEWIFRKTNREKKGDTRETRVKKSAITPGWKPRAAIC